MKTIKKISMLLILMLVGFGSVHVFADDADVVYRFPYAYGVHDDGRTVAIVGPVIEMDEDDYHVGMENQWGEWLEAYAEDFSGIPHFKYRDGSLGPHSSRSEAERRRREFTGDKKRDNDEVFETSRLDIPEFRYYPD